MMSKLSKTEKNIKKSKRHKNVSVIPDIEIDMSILSGLKVKFEDCCEYSDEEKKELTRLVKYFAQRIFIDKTYVNFKGNRWKDAFIKEEGWNSLMKMLYDSEYGNKEVSKEIDDSITTCLGIIAINYVVNTLIHYGYDISQFDIVLGQKTKFTAEYYKTKRTNWNF